MAGYKFAFEEDHILVTVWSAPNYSYCSGNSAAVLQLLSTGALHFVLFADVPDSERQKPPKLTVPYFL
jgi:hypothetical protein